MGTNVIASLGSVTITNNVAAVPVYFRKDALTEGTETFRFVLLASRDYALYSNIVSTVTVYDNSIARTLVLTTTATANTANEGESYIVNIYTTEMDDGTTLQWQIDGVDQYDLATALNGNVVLVDNYANVRVATVRDRNTEGPETVYFRILSNTHPSVEIPNNVYANVSLVDTSRTPNFYLYSNVVTCNEGDAVEYILETANLETNVIFTYNIEGISQNDLAFGSVTGKFVHNSYSSNAFGNGNVVIRFAKDFITEGNETARFNIFPDPSIKLLTNLYANVVVVDSSRTPSYSLSANVLQLQEGSTALFTLTGANVDNNVSFNYVIENVNAVDLVGGSAVLKGDMLFISNDGGFTGTATKAIGMARDKTTEGTETLVFKVLANPQYRLNTNLSVQISVLDTSKYPTLSLTANRSDVRENGVVQFNITSTDIDNGTSIEYLVSPIADVNSHVSAAVYTTTSGQFVVNATGQSSIIVNMKEDFITEGTEYLTITVPAIPNMYLDGRSVTIPIIDSSQTPSLSFSKDKDPVDEGDQVTITVTGTNIPNGTTISWSITAGSSDVTPTSGSFILTAGPNWPTSSNSIVLTAIADSTTEGWENYTITTGAVAAIGMPSYTVTGSINDTSVAPPPPPVSPPPASTPPPPGAVLTTFFNGNFEFTSPVSTVGTTVSIPGWKIYQEALRLNGFSTILNFPTPQDPTPSPRSAPTPYGDEPATNMAYSYEFVTDSIGDFGGQTVLRLISNGGTASPYGIARGPYVVSDYAITTAIGDKVVFHWKAEYGSDDYDVFAYLINETTGQTILLLDDNGYTTSGWQRVEKTIGAGETGTFKFVFICGSYDASGGMALGASLYLDNIDIIKAVSAPPPAPPAVPPAPIASAPAAPAAIVVSCSSASVVADIGSRGPGWYIFDIDCGVLTGTFSIDLDFLNNYDFAELNWNGNTVDTGISKGIKTLSINKTASAPNSIRLQINRNNITVTNPSQYSSGEWNTGGWWNGSGWNVLSVSCPSTNPTVPPSAPYSPLPDGTVTCPALYNGVSLTGTGTFTNGVALVTGSLNGGTVWGNNTQGYTDDSDFRRAVVHAGLLTPGQSGIIAFTPLGFRTNYNGTTSNGVTTTAWPSGWCGVQLSLFSLVT